MLTALALTVSLASIPATPEGSQPGVERSFETSPRLFAVAAF